MAAVSHHSAGSQGPPVRDLSATCRTLNPLKHPSLRSQFNEWIEVNGVWETPCTWEQSVSGDTCSRGGRT